MSISIGATDRAEQQPIAWLCWEFWRKRPGSRRSLPGGKQSRTGHFASGLWGPSLPCKLMTLTGEGTAMLRRLAAILAADVVGYSRLMGADEMGTISSLKSHRR